MLQAGLGGLFGKTFSTGAEHITVAVNKKLGGKYIYRQFNESGAVAEAIINMHKSGEISGQIFIIGHSLGAVEAVRVCEELEKNKIPVRYLVLLDYVWTLSNTLKRVFSFGKWKEKIPANVDHCDHFFTRDGRVRLIEGANNRPYFDINHIQLDNDPRVERDILENVSRYF